MIVSWTATCPQCGDDAHWQQRTETGQFGVQSGDITIHCGCDRHAA